MATPQFNPNKPSGFGADDATGARWINQGPWKFDPITKELLPGQIPEQSIASPPPPVATGGVEIPEVTGSPAAPRDPVTPKIGKAHPQIPKSPFPDGKKDSHKK